MNNKEIDKLKVIRTKLKTGEYDGTDIMNAWIAIDKLIDLIEWRDKAFIVHPNIDVDIEFITDNGA